MIGFDPTSPKEHNCIKTVMNVAETIFVWWRSNETALFPVLFLLFINELSQGLKEFNVGVYDKMCVKFANTNAERS